MRTITLALLLLLLAPLVADESKPPELTPEEQKLAAQAATLNKEAFQASQARRYPEAVAKLRQMLEICQKLYPTSKYPNGHLDLASCLNKLGFVLQAMGQSQQALGYHRQCLEMLRKLYPAAKYPDGHPDLARSLNNMGLVLRAMGQAERALGYYRQCLEMTQKLYPAGKFPDGHRDLAQSLNNLGFVLQAMGQSQQALGYFQQSLAMYQKLYPTAKHPDGHPELATCLNNLGVVLEAMGQAERALGYYRQSLEMKQKLYPTAKYPDGHADLALSLNNLGFVLNALGQAESALGYYRQSLAMYQKLYPAAKYPDGHPDLATSLNNMGGVLQDMGQAEPALGYYRQSLAMKQKLYPAAIYPDGHPDLAQNLNNLGTVLQAMGQVEPALGYYRQSLEMKQKLFSAAKYPDGHPDLALSLNNLGAVFLEMGQTEPALGYFRQSLEMRRKLFPAAKYREGHPDIASCLNDLGAVLRAMGQPEPAIGYFRESLEMKQKLHPAAKYPDGHPSIALSLNNLGLVLAEVGQVEQALGYYRQSLEMKQKLYPAAKYPDGHPSIAVSLNNLGLALEAMGQTEPALSYHRQSLEMRRKHYPSAKYPDGHPDLANSLNNLGQVLSAMGQDEQALPHFRDALAMQQRLLRRELATASEEAAFDKVKAEPLYRDFYLNVTRSTGTPAAEVVAQLWSSRSMVTRLLEQRQANARAAGTELGDQLDRLRGLRRRLDQLLQDTRMKPEERDKLLTAVANERDGLERELVEKIPAWKKWRAIDDLGPADLAKALPPGAVFIDLIRYTHFEYIDKKKRTPSYVAFVLAKDRPVQRIDFDEPALAIDKAVSDWQTAIDQRGSSASADWLREKVWARLAPHIPEGTTTLYLAAAGDLARMPWAALPTGNGRVLLEDYAIAQVPHGTFLLDQLLHPSKYDGPESLLTVGGVDYGGTKLEFLPGTVTETSAIAAIAPGRHVGVTGKEATAEKLHALMPQARYVHLATHGEFNADELTKERQRAAKALESRQLGDELRRIGAKNPLGYVGILLADGKALSGLGIVDLPLQNTRLVTLSACETGLGALTGGEGVQGLQRAFHLAGCPNVVASLWKVNDAATAALMAKFYHEMWVNKKPPIEALREAQLTIYRHPERIPALSGERGKPDFAKTVELKPDLNPDAGAQGSKRTPTKLWAAFVLSGVGK